MYVLVLASVGLWILFIYPTVFILAGIIIGGFYWLTSLPTPTEESESRGEKDFFDRDFLTYKDRIKYNMDRMKWKTPPKDGTEEADKAQALKNHILNRQKLSDMEMKLQELEEEREAMLKGAGTK